MYICTNICQRNSIWFDNTFFEIVIFSLIIWDGFGSHFVCVRLGLFQSFYGGRDLLLFFCWKIFDILLWTQQLSYSKLSFIIFFTLPVAGSVFDKGMFGHYFFACAHNSDVHYNIIMCHVSLFLLRYSSNLNFRCCFVIDIWTFSQIYYV